MSSSHSDRSDEFYSLSAIDHQMRTSANKSLAHLIPLAVEGQNTSRSSCKRMETNGQLLRRVLRCGLALAFTPALKAMS